MTYCAICNIIKSSKESKQRKAADKYGDEYCRKAIDKYLYDESDTRTPDEFIDDLNRGTENVEN